MQPTIDDDAALARAAGLAKAWAEHRADVREAIARAVAMRASFQRPDGPAAEPSPAFRAPGAAA